MDVSYQLKKKKKKKKEEDFAPSDPSELKLSLWYWWKLRNRSEFCTIFVI